MLSIDGLEKQLLPFNHLRAEADEISRDYSTFSSEWNVKYRFRHIHVSTSSLASYLQALSLWPHCLIQEEKEEFDDDKLKF